MENVLQFEGAASCLSVKVQTAVGEAACFQNFVHAQCCIIYIGGELVGIPAQQRIALVCIDRTEHAVGSCNAELVLEGVLCQCCVVCFDVQLEILVQAVLLQEANYSCRVEVILMLGGLLRLRFYIEVTGKADASCIIYCQVHQTSHVVQFQTHVGVQQGFITFTAAPENVALAAQLYCCVDCDLDLCSCIGKNICTGRSAGTMHITWMIKALCSTPQQLLSGFVLLLLTQVYDFSQLFICFAEGAILRRQISVMKAVVINAQLVHDLKCCFYLSLCPCSRICAAPGLVRCATAEHIGTVTTHGVPPGQRKLQLFLHGLSGYNFIRIIKLKCQWVLGVLSLVCNFGNALKKFAHFE